MMIAVQITDRHGGRMTAVCLVRNRFLERTVPVAEEYAHVVTESIGCHEVKFAVAVKVAHRCGHGVYGNIQDRGSKKTRKCAKFQFLKSKVSPLISLEHRSTVTVWRST